MTVNTVHFNRDNENDSALSESIGSIKCVISKDNPIYVLSQEALKKLTFKQYPHVKSEF